MLRKIRERPSLNSKRAFVAIMIAVALFLVLLPSSSLAQEPILVATVTAHINGTRTATTGPIDICGAIHQGSCPFSITLTESLDVMVQSRTTAGTVLPEGSPATISASLSPSSPTVVLSAALTSGVKSYPASFTVPNYPLTGKYTIPGPCLPVGTILDALGIPAPPFAIPLKICLNPEFSNSIKGKFNGTGFANYGLITWTSLDAQETKLQISNSSSLTLFEELSAEQTISLIVAIEPIATNSVIAALPIPLNVQDFTSQPSALFTWYRIAIDKPDGGSITPSPGTSWYSKNYQLALQATPDLTHQFENWQVNGKIVSNSSSLAFPVKAPTEIAAFFAISATGILIYVSPVILLALFLTLYYVFSNRENTFYSG
jgi:hypothetical protein